MSASDVFLAIIAFLFPPLAVWIKRGICSVDSLINIALSMLGYVPGLIHAWYIIAKYPEPEGYDSLSQEEEGRRARVVYVTRSESGAGQPDGGRAQRELQRGGSGYGTLRAASQQRAGESGEGSQGAPPSYVDAVKGDNKVQGP